MKQISLPKEMVPSKQCLPIALYAIGLSLLASFPPFVYSPFAGARTRLLLVALTAVLLLVLATFAMRYLYRRLHDTAPTAKELLRAWLIVLISAVAFVLLSALLTALLRHVFHVAMAQSIVGSQSFVGAVTNALLFPLLLCAIITALAAKSGFLQQLWQSIKRCYLWLLAAAVVCFAGGWLFSGIIGGILGVILSALLMALLLTFGAELCLAKR